MSYEDHFPEGHFNMSDFHMPHSYYDPPEYDTCEQKGCGGNLNDNNDCVDCGEHTLTQEDCNDIRADRAYDERND